MKLSDVCQMYSDNAQPLEQKDKVKVCKLNKEGNNIKMKTKHMKDYKTKKNFT